ncbi:MAG: NADH:flavin oxidoreductase [Deltaproteobacteria bacterium]|nr:NADH:flavin oxidoreductase [Deltaproteobacteria bacterium]
MKQLFENTTIGKLQLRNRLVRSASWEGLADDDGASTHKLNQAMVALAENDIGLIITGHSYVSPEGKAGPRQLGVYDDALLPMLEQMTAAVHKADGAIVLQLAHAGVNAVDSTTAIGPTAFTTPAGKSCRSMTLDDIAHTVAAFAAAAGRAKEAGFDGVQIHAAHGYLLNQFLSPYYNKRDDEYGGSIENRARILLEIFAQIRDVVGDYPVLVKLNSDDFLDGGFNLEEMLVVATMLQQAGIDAIELSGGTIYEPGKYGTVRQGKIALEDEGYYRNAAKRYKEQIDVPLILVGGLRSYEVAQELLVNGDVDFIALSRPLIREPNLVRRWRAGDHSPATCISCNACYGPIFEDKGFYCPLDH